MQLLEWKIIVNRKLQNGNDSYRCAFRMNDLVISSSPQKFSQRKT